MTGALVADRFEHPEHVAFIADWQEAADHTAQIAREGDFVITLGCGDVYRIVPQLLDSLRRVRGVARRREASCRVSTGRRHGGRAPGRRRSAPAPAVARAVRRLRAPAGRSPTRSRSRAVRADPDADAGTRGPPAARDRLLAAPELAEQPRDRQGAPRRPRASASGWSAARCAASPSGRAAAGSRGSAAAGASWSRSCWAWSLVGVLAAARARSTSRSSGTSRLDAGAIVAKKLGDQLGTPLPLVDQAGDLAATWPRSRSSAATRVESHPPDTIVVRVVERQPVGVVQQRQRRSSWWMRPRCPSPRSAKRPGGLPAHRRERARRPTSDADSGFAAAAAVLSALPADRAGAGGHHRARKTKDDVSFTLRGARRDRGLGERRGLGAQGGRPRRAAEERAGVRRAVSTSRRRTA